MKLTVNGVEYDKRGEDWFVRHSSEWIKCFGFEASVLDRLSLAEKVVEAARELSACLYQIDGNKFVTCLVVTAVRAVNAITEQRNAIAAYYKASGRELEQRAQSDAKFMDDMEDGIR